MTGTPEDPASVYSDEMICTLGGFSELTKAVRDGDLATVSILCAQLFDLESRGRAEGTRLKPNPAPMPKST